MQLIANNLQASNITFIRDLNDVEIASHMKYAHIFAEARSRLSLFRMLNTNFLEWRSFIDNLGNSEANEPDNPLEELNRLLLNYLTCAYTIREHFDVSFQQRYRKSNQKRAEFKAFFTALCRENWAFGFFTDFRGYVQHQGFGVCHYARHVGKAKIQVVVSADVKKLLSENRNWKCSALTPTHGTIDLVGKLQEYHDCMIQRFGSYVAKTFYPELKPASEFYGSLTSEAKTKAKDINARMMFVENTPKPSHDADIVHITLKMLLVPNSVYEELGISISRKHEPINPSAGVAT